MRAPALATTVLLACLALVGCEKDAVGPVDPDDTATPSEPSTTPTPTGPTPPVLPDAAKANTAQGAIAFVEHDIDLLNAASATGDVAALRRSTRGCEGCDNYAELYEKTYADGGYFRDVMWEPVGPVADTAKSPAVVLIDVETAKVRYRLKAADKEGVGPASYYKLRFELQRAADGWAITRFTEQPTPR